MSDADQPTDGSFEFHADTTGGDSEADSSRATRLADGKDLDIANPEDFEVQRNDKGEIDPEPQRVPGTDSAIMVEPMTPGAFAENLPVLEMEDEDSERQAEVIREWVDEPERLASADADYVENTLRGGWLAGILQAIRNSAGYEVFREVRAQQLRENAALAQEIDEDLLDRALETAMAEGASPSSAATGGRQR